jgi:hypothetical protein
VTALGPGHGARPSASSSTVRRSRRRGAAGHAHQCAPRARSPPRARTAPTRARGRAGVVSRELATISTVEPCSSAAQAGGERVEEVGEQARARGRSRPRARGRSPSRRARWESAASRWVEADARHHGRRRADKTRSTSSRRSSEPTGRRSPLRRPRARDAGAPARARPAPLRSRPRAPPRATGEVDSSEKSGPSRRGCPARPCWPRRRLASRPPAPAGRGRGGREGRVHGEVVRRALRGSPSSSPRRAARSAKRPASKREAAPDGSLRAAVPRRGVSPSAMSSPRRSG